MYWGKVSACANLSQGLFPDNAPSSIFSAFWQHFSHPCNSTLPKQIFPASQTQVEKAGREGGWQRGEVLLFLMLCVLDSSMLTSSTCRLFHQTDQLIKFGWKAACTFFQTQYIELWRLSGKVEQLFRVKICLSDQMQPVSSDWCGCDWITWHWLHDRPALMSLAGWLQPLRQWYFDHVGMYKLSFKSFNNWSAENWRPSRSLSVPFLILSTAKQGRLDLSQSVFYFVPQEINSQAGSTRVG